MSETAMAVMEPVGEILTPEGPYAQNLARYKSTGARLLDAAKKIQTISTAAGQTEAVAMGRLLQAENKALAEFFKPFKQHLDGLKNAVLDDEKATRHALDVEKQRLANLIGDWEAGEERKRQELMRREREAAENEETERRLEAAIALENEGFGEAAEAALSEQMMPPVIAQRSAPVRVEGKITRTTYRGKVIDFAALVRAVSAGVVPIEAIEINQSFLNKQADAFREGLSWPGVAVEKTVGTHFRSGR